MTDNLKNAMKIRELAMEHNEFFRRSGFLLYGAKRDFW